MSCGLVCGGGCRLLILLQADTIQATTTGQQTGPLIKSKDNTGSTDCSVDNGDQLKDAVEKGSCSIVTLTQLSDDAYILHEEIIVR